LFQLKPFQSLRIFLEPDSSEPLLFNHLNRNVKPPSFIGYFCLNFQFSLG
jgi:hypothetical protein